MSFCLLFDFYGMSDFKFEFIYDFFILIAYGLNF